MILHKPSILINILEYTNMSDMLNIYILTSYSKYIISNSKFNNNIITFKLKYIKALISDNSQSISMCIQNIMGICRHLYLLDNKPSQLNINNTVYVRKCVLCDYKLIRDKRVPHNTTETEWQHYIKNENIQHELILRTDINKKPNIMNVFTVDLNSYYNNPINRYSYIRYNIIQKLNTLQLLILSYCDGDKSNLLVNKSWGQFIKRNKEILVRGRINKRKIEILSFENEILNYKMNELKREKRCNHEFKSYKNQFNINYCIKCKYINGVENDTNQKYKKLKSQ